MVTRSKQRYPNIQESNKKINPAESKESGNLNNITSINCIITSIEHTKNN